MSVSIVKSLRVLALLAVGLLASVAMPSLPAQESKAVFHAPLAVLPGNSPPFQKLADFDGDGDLDAVGSWVYSTGASAQVVVWENVGGEFSVAFTAPVVSGLVYGHNIHNFALTTADFNQDGLMDFAVVTSTAVVRFVAGASFQFTASTLALSATLDGSHAIAAGDLDGDGSVDLAVARSHASLSLATLDLFLAGGVVVSTPLAVNGLAALRLETAELDASPGLELLVSDRSKAVARIYRIGSGQPQVVATLTSTMATFGMPWLWTAGDTDQDGDVDVVVFVPGSTGSLAQYETFRHGSTGAFALEPTEIGGPAEYLADIDGDGDLDGVCCGGGGGQSQVHQWPGLWFASTFELAVNDGSGSFAPAWNFPGAGSRSMAGAADVDGDGDVDLVAGRCIFYGDGPWDAHPLSTAMGATGLAPGRRWQFKDLDGDGDTDIDHHQPLVNRGDGAFQPSARTLNAPAGYTVDAATSCDVDGDGFVDQIVRLFQAGTTFSSMAWFRGNGAGGMQYVGPCTAPGVAMWSSFSLDRCLVADCDGDGDQDIVVRALPIPGSVGSSQIWLNTNGMFAHSPLFPVATGRVDAVADFNGDGNPDLLLTGTAHGVSVHLGGGVGQPYQLAWSRPQMPFEAGTVAVGDVNDDGALDFVRPNGFGSLVLFVNTLTQAGVGFTEVPLTGSFVTLTNWLGGSTSSAVSIADVDADGMSDIVFGAIPGEANICGILRRQSWSSPPTIADFEVRRQAILPGYVVDADADGMPDIVGEHTVRNRHYSRAEAGGRLQLHAGPPTGEAGTSPLLGASGPFRVGHTGQYLLTSVPGPTLAVLGLSLGSAQLPNTPFPGMSLYLDLGTLLVANWPITVDGDGRAAASASRPMVLIHGLQGFRFYSQAFVLDPSAPNSLTQSNQLVTTIGT